MSVRGNVYNSHGQRRLQYVVGKSPIVDDLVIARYIGQTRPSLRSKAHWLTGAITPALYLRGRASLRLQGALEGPRARLDSALLVLRSFV